MNSPVESSDDDAFLLQGRARLGRTIGRPRPMAPRPFGV